MKFISSMAWNGMKTIDPIFFKCLQKLVDVPYELQCYERDLMKQK